jgi:hypothetical protein
VLRLALALLAGAAVASLGAVILGEYPFTGVAPLAAGVLLGVLVGEVLVALRRARGALVGAVAAVYTGAAMVWAGWISTGHDLGRMASVGWVAVALGAVAGAVAGMRPRPLSRRA